MKKSFAALSILSVLFFFTPFTASANCAIAFNNASYTFKNTAVSPATVSFTTTGSDVGMLIAIYASQNSITAVTFNGVSATNVSTDAWTEVANFTSLWFAPNVGATAGTVSISFSSGTVFNVGIASYTCVSHSSTVDNHMYSHNAANTASSNVLSSVADNAWHVAFHQGSNFGAVVGANTTSRAIGAADISTVVGDNNAAIHPAGSNTLNFTSSSADQAAIQGATLAPFIPAVIVPNFGTLTFFGWF